MKKKFQLQVGMNFSTFKVCRKALQQYIIENGIDYKYIKNEPARITMVCKNECGWRIHASKSSDGQSYQIKTWNHKDHNCGWVRDNKKVNSTWLIEQYLDDIRDQPEWRPTIFVNAVQR